MIRNVVMGRVRDEPEALDEVRAALAGIAALDAPGRAAHEGGLDAGLRAGGWSFALTNDWVDAESYHRYDLDPEHNLHRARIAAVCEDIARVQFTLPDPGPA